MTTVKPSTFCWDLFWRMGVSSIIVTIVMLVTVTFARMVSTARREAAMTNNSFWYMLAGTHPANTTELGKMAQDLRALAGKPHEDVVRKFAILPYCDPHRYPGLGEIFHDSLFSAEEGGFVQPAFMLEIERFKRGGLKEAVRPLIRYPISLPPSVVDEANKGITGLNQVWQMVAGTTPTTSKPEGRLASDLRHYLDGSTIEFMLKPYCDPSAYKEAEEALDGELFYSQYGERNGLVRAAFLKDVQTCLTQGPNQFIQSVPAKPAYDQFFFGWRVLSPAFLLGLWMLLSSGAYLCISKYGLPTWPKAWEERVCYGISLLLAPQIFALGALTRTTFFYDWATAKGRAWYAEWRHPYRYYRRKARKTLARLQRLPEQTEEVKAQIKNAEEILSASAPQHRRHRDVSHLAAQAAEAELTPVLAAIKAKQEVDEEVKSLRM